MKGKTLDAPPQCPECASQRVWKDGIRHTEHGDVQRWLCRSCGHRFSDTKIKVDILKEGFELPDSVHDLRHLDTVDLVSGKVGFQNPPLPVGEDVGSHAFTDIGKRINSFLPYDRERQVCATESVAKNLSHQRTRVKKRAAGATKLDKDAKSLLFRFAWHMKKQGYAESTISGRAKLLRILAKRGANLYEPDTIKDVIARQQWCPGRKENAVHAYSSFLKMTGGKWEPPRYRRVETLPWVPTETNVDQLIAGCSRRVATFLQLLKETGMRPGEAWILRWIDLDFNSNTVRVTPKKRSKPRILKLSNKLVAMLKALPQRNEYVFKSGLLKHFRGGFTRQRKRIAAKLENPQINRIKFKTFRHFKGTMEYHKTKDILHVMQVLGHKNIKNTLIYTHLVEFKADEFISKVAKTADEASELVEAGFEYVCTTPEDLMLFRKRK